VQSPGRETGVERGVQQVLALPQEASRVLECQALQKIFRRDARQAEKSRLK